MDCWWLLSQLTRRYEKGPFPADGTAVLISVLKVLWILPTRNLHIFQELSLPLIFLHLLIKWFRDRDVPVCKKSEASFWRDGTAYWKCRYLATFIFACAPRGQCCTDIILFLHIRPRSDACIVWYQIDTEMWWLRASNTVLWKGSLTFFLSLTDALQITYLHMYVHYFKLSSVCCWWKWISLLWRSPPNIHLTIFCYNILIRDN